MNEKIVGIRLKELRESKGMSQAKLAQVLGGISQPVVARYERGDIFPSYPVLVKIADYFNVSTDYMLGRTEKPEGEIYGSASSLTEDDIEDFINACFDPNRVENKKFKAILRKLLMDQL